MSTTPPDKLRFDPVHGLQDQTAGEHAHEHHANGGDDVSAAGGEELFGLIAEYDTVDAVMEAARAVRDAGYKRWDVHAPFPIHGIDEAMGTRATSLPWVILTLGTIGGLSGVFLTCYTMAVTLHWYPLPESFKGYQYMISAKPYLSIPAYIAPIFELTILLSSFGAVFGMFMMNKLPLLASPLFTSERFRRATSDRFFISIEARDPSFEQDATTDLLHSTHPTEVEAVPER